MAGLDGDWPLFLIGAGLTAATVLWMWSGRPPPAPPEPPEREALRQRLLLQAAMRRLTLSRLGAAAQVLQLLQPDLSHEANCQLEVELRPAPRHATRVEDWRTKKGWLMSSQERWLRVRGVLADGSRFTLTLAQHEERHQIGRENARGRRKLKRTEHESGLQVRLTLKPRRGRYGDVSGAVAAPGARTLPQGLLARPVTHKAGTVRAVVLSPQQGRKPTDAVAAAFFSLYDRLGAAQPPGETP